ncbi:hypothetical protein [Mycobacterium sp. SMC-4]|uniref:hypothetical protein n=1 Tax=Mycobacterium sp. SMC-4 TaxID=2857059 RepID=UPI0021B43417|nr:hypothetical protein [Mycobacterium sp. SMC-4]
MTEAETEAAAPADPPVANDAAKAELPSEAAPEAPVTSPAQPRSWSMPKSPVTRQHLGDAGRAAVKTVAALAGFVAGAARAGGRAIRQLWRGLLAVPPAGRLFIVTGPLMLLGVAGAVALDNSIALLCTVFVVPVCAGILGALGYRWYSGLGADDGVTRTDPRPAPPADSDLQRSVHYVDRKLALALTSLGTDRHQQAVIALFQAKTAVELTLGTEQDLASYADMTLRPDDYGLRPRIRAGSGATTSREGNSLAAS